MTTEKHRKTAWEQYLERNETWEEATKGDDPVATSVAMARPRPPIGAKDDHAELVALRALLQTAIDYNDSCQTLPADIWKGGIDVVRRALGTGG